MKPKYNQEYSKEENVLNKQIAIKHVNELMLLNQFTKKKNTIMQISLKKNAEDIEYDFLMFFNC